MSWWAQENGIPRSDFKSIASVFLRLNAVSLILCISRLLDAIHATPMMWRGEGKVARVREKSGGKYLF